MKDSLNQGGRVHQTGIRRFTDRTALGIPRNVIKPTQECIETVFIDVFRAAPVEMGIEFMDDWFVRNVGELTDRKC
jgi:hypothetical protein